MWVSEGKQAIAFGAVADAFNKNKSFPSTVDSKHCVDKFKALIKSFKSTDDVRRSSSGGTEPFGEKEVLLYDIVARISDEDSRMREL